MTRQVSEIDRIFRWACMLTNHDCPPLEVLRKSIQSAYDCGYIDGTNKERTAARKGLKNLRAQLRRETV